MQSSVDIEIYSLEELENHKRTTLQALCKQHQLRATGKNQELISRLHEFYSDLLQQSDGNSENTSSYSNISHSTPKHKRITEIVDSSSSEVLIFSSEDDSNSVPSSPTANGSSLDNTESPRSSISTLEETSSEIVIIESESEISSSISEVNCNFTPKHNESSLDSINTPKLTKASLIPFDDEMTEESSLVDDCSTVSSNSTKGASDSSFQESSNDYIAESTLITEEIITIRKQSDTLDNEESTEIMEEAQKLALELGDNHVEESTETDGMESQDEELMKEDDTEESDEEEIHEDEDEDDKKEERNTFDEDKEKTIDDEEEDDNMDESEDALENTPPRMRRVSVVVETVTANIDREDNTISVKKSETVTDYFVASDDLSETESSISSNDPATIGCISRALGINLFTGKESLSHSDINSSEGDISEEDKDESDGMMFALDDSLINNSKPVQSISSPKITVEELTEQKEDFEGTCSDGVEDMELEELSESTKEPSCQNSPMKSDNQKIGIDSSIDTCDDNLIEEIDITPVDVKINNNVMDEETKSKLLDALSEESTEDNNDIFNSLHLLATPKPKNPKKELKETDEENEDDTLAEDGEDNEDNENVQETNIEEVSVAVPRRARKSSILSKQSIASRKRFSHIKRPARVSSVMLQSPEELVGTSDVLAILSNPNTTNSKTEESITKQQRPSTVKSSSVSKKPNTIVTRSVSNSKSRIPLSERATKPIAKPIPAPNKTKGTKTINNTTSTLGKRTKFDRPIPAAKRPKIEKPTISRTKASSTIPKARKMPDFDSIHEKQFEQQKSIVDVHSTGTLRKPVATMKADGDENTDNVSSKPQISLTSKQKKSDSSRQTVTMEHKRKSTLQSNPQRISLMERSSIVAKQKADTLKASKTNTKKPVFDLKASLNRELSYKPKRGPLPRGMVAKKKL